MTEEAGARDLAPALAVTIPFPFVAGGALLPAGAYLLRMLSRASRALVMSSRTDASLRATLAVAEVPGADQGVPKLVFQRRGDGYHVAGLHYRAR